MPTLVLDLEVIADPDLPFTGTSRPDGDPVPAPIHCKIVSATGLLLDDEYRPVALRTFADEVRAISSNVARLSRDDAPLLVTFGGRHFDLPVLAARAFVHGIPFPRYYASKSRDAADMRYRYDAAAHLDVMDYCADFGMAKKARQDAFARAIGFPGKRGVDGGDVAAMWAAGRVGDIAQYNAEDVVQLAAIFFRVQLIRGILKPASYRTVMGEYLAWLATLPAMAPLLREVDRKRAMTAWEREE